MTPERLREIQERETVATPGPWRLWDEEISPTRITDVSGDIDALLDCSEDARGFNRPEDARFCVGARQDVPDLLSALHQALEERDQLAAALQSARTIFESQANPGTWRELGNPDFTRLIQTKAKEFLMSTTDPAECLKARDARITTLEDALIRLNAEVSGLVGIAEPELRQACGNTNINLLKIRMAQARAAITESKSEPQPDSQDKAG